MIRYCSRRNMKIEIYDRVTFERAVITQHSTLWQLSCV
jgi:hypothetical protein